MVSNASNTKEATTLAKNTSERLQNCSSSNKMPEQLDSLAATLPPPAPSPQPPPPPPPPFPSSSSSTSSGKTRNLLSRPESAPPVGCSSSQRGFGSRTAWPAGAADPSSLQLPQQRIPLPRAPMKRLQWTKIPASAVASSPDNVWKRVADTCGGYQINFQRMEELFSSAAVVNGGGRGAHSANVGNGSRVGDASYTVDGNFHSLERKTKRTDEINLIDGKRSMNVNVFLRQFRMTNFDIVRCLRLGQSSEMGPERLRTLLKILPEPEDVQLLLNFDGDRNLLGTAEKFYMELISLPNYRYLTEALLAKEEFPPAIGYIRPAIEAIVLSARGIKDCKALHEIMYNVVMAGNFLNSGVYSGNAVGFQLDSLLKLSDLSSNKPRVSLLHFVAQETEGRNPQLIEQLKELKHLSEASQYSVDYLTSEIAALRSRVQAISSWMTDCDSKFQEQMKLFLEEANADLEALEFDAKELEKLRLGLATFFCEDAGTFKLDDCISIFNSFCRMFLKAVEENKERNQQNERAEERRRLREEQMATKRMALTSKESTMTTNFPSDAVGQSVNDAVDHSARTTSDRRIPISQTMPSFLLESNQWNAPTDEIQRPGRLPHHRHRNRNSESDGGRRTLPSTPTGSEAAGQNENELLLNALLMAAADEAPDRRPRRRSRSRSGIVGDHRPGAGRERSVSPPGSSLPGDPSLDALRRDQPGRSSCPSRLSGGQGRTVRDSPLLGHRQLSGRDSATAAEKSDAEMNAKQERDSRRMERSRRSQRCSDETSSVLAPASCLPTSPRETNQELGRILASNRSHEMPTKERPDKLHFFPTIDSDAREKKTDSEKSEVAGRIHGGGFLDSSPSPADALVEGLISRPGSHRRDAANIRSLGEQQGLLSAETVSTPQPLSSRRQSLSGGEVAEEAPGLSASSKSRLSSLVKQNNIPVQRVSVAAKKRNPGQDGGGGGGAQKDWAGGQKKSRSQSDYRLTTRSRDNLVRETNKNREKSKSSDVGTSLPVEGTILNSTKDAEATVHEALSQDQSSDSDDGHQNGFDPESGEQSKLPSSGNQRGPSSHGDGTSREGDEPGGKAGCPPAMTLKSVAVTDYGEMGRRATAFERASSRKEKLKKLSEIYASKDSDDQVSDSSEAVDGAREPSPNEDPSAQPGIDRHHPPPSGSGPLFGPYDAARDEGVDVEGTASQRTSMSSTVDSDVRVTPLMDRKEYEEGGGERKVVPDPSSTKQQRRPRRSPAVPGAVRASKEPRESGANVSTKKTTVLPRIPPSEALQSQVKGQTANGGGGGGGGGGGKGGVGTQLKAISVPKPKSSTSSAVRYRIAKPNLVAYSSTPSPDSRADKEADKPKSDVGGGTRDLSSSLKIGPMSVKIAKMDPKPRLTSTVKRPSSVVTVVAGPSLSSSRQTPKTDRKTPTDFVRGSGARATLPAATGLVENKRTALDSRLARDAASPVQPSEKKSMTSSSVVEKNKPTSRIGQYSNSLPRKLPSLPPTNTANHLATGETSRLSPHSSSTSVVRDPRKLTKGESSARNVIKREVARTPTLNAGCDKAPKVSSLGRVVNNLKPNSRSMSPSTTAKASHATTQSKDSSNVTTVTYLFTS